MRNLSFSDSADTSVIEIIFNAIAKLFADRCKLEDGEYISIITFEKENGYLARVAIDKDSPDFEEFLKKSVEFVVSMK